MTQWPFRGRDQGHLAIPGPIHGQDEEIASRTAAGVVAATSISAWCSAQLQVCCGMAFRESGEMCRILYVHLWSMYLIIYQISIIIIYNSNYFIYYKILWLYYKYYDCIILWLWFMPTSLLCLYVNLYPSHIVYLYYANIVNPWPGLMILVDHVETSQGAQGTHLIKV